MASFGARDIGVLFVQKYYDVLKKNPESAQGFYTEGSSVVRVDAESEKRATTLTSINDLLLSLKYGEAPVFEAIDSASCPNGDILVQLSALVKTKKVNSEGVTVEVRKKMLQSLALRPNGSGGYFVMTDIVRYVEAEPETVKKVSQPEPQTVKPVSYSSVAAVPPTAAAAAAAPVKSSKAPSAPQTKAAAPAAPQKEKEREKEVPGCSVYVRNLPPGSTRSEVRSFFKEYGKIKHDGVYVKTHPETNFCFGFVDFETAEGAQKAVNDSPVTCDGEEITIELKKSAVKKSSPTAAASPTKTGCCVHVRNLAPGTTRKQVRESFSEYGTIKYDGVCVKTNQENTFCFGFVDFDTAEAANKAVQASPMPSENGEITIELKRPSNNSNNTTGPSSSQRKR